jgi:hypothetical protein
MLCTIVTKRVAVFIKAVKVFSESKLNHLSNFVKRNLVVLVAIVYSH